MPYKPKQTDFLKYHYLVAGCSESVSFDEAKRMAWCLIYPAPCVPKKELRKIYRARRRKKQKSRGRY